LPRELRPAFAALWNVDLALADVVATSSDARLAAIRLAWWRERLEELDEGMTAPAEPRLQAVASELVPRGITGTELSQLEDAWLPVLEPFPWTSAQAEGMRLRGQILFGIGARLLGQASEEAGVAGTLWSLVDAAEHCSDAPSREMLRRAAAAHLGEMRQRMPPRLRVLTVLAALAAADLMRESSGLRRLSAALRHKLWGTMPR
jgi:phytoene synthase